jgi:hypothetical protein
MMLPRGLNPLESPDREQRGGDGGTTFPTVITNFIFTEFNNVNLTEVFTSTFFADSN